MLDNLNPEELALEVQRERCRRSLGYFTRKFWNVLEPGRELTEGPVLDALDLHLEAVARGDIQKLVITVPPGSMKSYKVRVLWPLWVWLRDPTKRFLTFSHANDLSTTHTMKSRYILQDPEFQRLFPEIRLRSDQDAKTYFINTKHGEIRGGSAKGSTTGKRGDFLIVDDPHDVSEAESNAERSKAVAWFKESLQSRTNDKTSGFVVIMQRIHHEDVAAAAIEMGYELLNIPAFYEPARHCRTSIGWEDWRTEDGENFWPDRFPTEDLEAFRDMDPYMFATQYQQNPSPREGGLFRVDKLQTIDTLPEVKQWYEGWDLAATESNTSAYTARVRLGLDTEGRVIVASAQRQRLRPKGIVDWIKQVVDQSLEAELPVKFILPIDPAAGGVAQRTLYEPSLLGANFRWDRINKGKEVLAEPFAAQVENGNVILRKESWNSDYIEELRGFPKSNYKDQVDATTIAFNELVKERKKTKVAPKIGTHFVPSKFRM